MDFTALAKSDIFFVVTTSAVVVISVIIIIALVYLIEILSAIRRISGKAERATEQVTEDIDSLRQDIKSRGFSLAAFGRFFKRLFGTARRSKKNTK